MVANDIKIFLSMKNKGYLSIEKKYYNRWINKTTSQIKSDGCFVTSNQKNFFKDKYMKLFLEISVFNKNKIILEIPALREV